MDGEPWGKVREAEVQIREGAVRVIVPRGEQKNKGEKK
jgi:diacylglycerol kinase family enzyme